MNRGIPYFFSLVFCVAFFVVADAQDIDTFPSVATEDSIYQTTVTPSENYEFREPAGNTVNTRKVPDTKLHELKADEEYWYVDKAPEGDREISPPGVNQKGKKEKQERIRRSGEINFPPWLRVLFWIILIGGFLALLIWFLATGNIRLFRKKAATVEESGEEQLTEDIFEINFEKEIQKAIGEKKYRSAVRLMYLRTLRDLSNSNLIDYTHEKTNGDYLLQLSGTPYYKNFFKLTRSFDYTWYGHFQLSQDSFAIIQNDFSLFKQQVS